MSISTNGIALISLSSIVPQDTCTYSAVMVRFQFPMLLTVVDQLSILLNRAVCTRKR